MSRFYSFITLILAVVLLGACSSKPTADPEMLNRAADILNSTFKPTSTTVTDSNITVSVYLDTLMIPSAAGYPVSNFLIAERMRQIPSDSVKMLTTALSDANLKLRMQLKSDSSDENFDYTPEQLISLRKAPRIELDLPAVRAGVVSMIESINGAALRAIPGVREVNFTLENGFITFTILWDGNKTFSKSDQGLLTKLYEPMLKAEVKSFEQKIPGICDMLNNAGIDGFRVQYATGSDGKIVLKEAFPWRVLL